MDGEIEAGTEVMVIDPGGGNVVTVAPVAEYEDEIDRELARGRREAAAEAIEESNADGDDADDAVEASDHDHDRPRDRETEVE
jgi:F0F1-type ATP synthase epsilon subunit